MSKISLLILPDLHGRDPKIPEDKDFDYIITPGDIVLDNIRNIKKSFEESEYEDLDDFCENIENESIQKGDEILSKLNELQKPVYIIPGNWDPTKYCDGMLKDDCAIWDELIEKYENITDCEYISVENSDFQIIGHGSTSAPELLHNNILDLKVSNLDNEDEDFESEMYEVMQRHRYQKSVYEKLDELFQITNNKKEKITIFLSHNAPYNTPLDLIQNENSALNGEHYGSIITRDLVEKYEPQLVICGHIHEGVGICKIGKSICLNSGFGDNIYHIVTIDTIKNKVLKVEKFGENQKE